MPTFGLQGCIIRNIAVQDLVPRSHKETTVANVHDSQKLELLDPSLRSPHETVAVHADSTYKSRAVDEVLAGRGIKNGIVGKRVRGQAVLSEEPEVGASRHKNRPTASSQKYARGSNIPLRGSKSRSAN